MKIVRFGIVTFFILGLLTSSAPKVNAQVPTFDEGKSGNITENVYTASGWDKCKEQLLSFDVGCLAGLAAGVASWDGVAKTLAHEALQMMKDQTLDWIESGFEGGGPLFVQNPGQYFAEVGDEASGAFLAELGNQINGDPEFFCKDFAPDIILEFGSYRRRGWNDRARCTINDVADNLERFTENFENGGWDRWFQMRSSNNNLIGFQLDLFEEQMYRASVRKGDAEVETSTGQGYKPVRECIEWEEREAPYSDESGQTSFERVCKKYKSKSIGKQIGDRVATTLNIDYEGVLTADEVSEIVEALVSMALREAISAGLSG